MTAPTRQIIWITLLGALLLAFTRSPVMGDAWQRNRASLAIWQQMDIPRSLADMEDRLYLKAGGSAAALAQQMVSPCQDLWISYLWASTDLRRAKQAAGRAQACPRPEFVYRWAGTLAWLGGDPAGARRNWAKLRPYALAQWGRDLVLQEETALGRILLEIARDLNDTGQPLRPAAQALLFKTLGDLERKSGNLKQSTDYYQLAWQASGYAYGPIPYHLGNGYAAQGDCPQAIQIWETGLQHPTERQSPQMDTSYLLKLAECYLKIGDYARAGFYLDAAQTLINTHHLTYTIHQDWLNKIRQQLSKMP